MRPLIDEVLRAVPGKMIYDALVLRNQSVWARDCEGWFQVEELHLSRRMIEETLLQYEQESEVRYHTEMNQEGYTVRAELIEISSDKAIHYRIYATKSVQPADVHVPQGLLQLCDYRSGLAILASPPGQGKTTLLASFLAKMKEQSFSGKSLFCVTSPDSALYLYSQNGIVVRESCDQQISIPLDVWAYDVIDSRAVIEAIERAVQGERVFLTLSALDSVSAIKKVLGILRNQGREDLIDQYADALNGVVAEKLVRHRESGVMPIFEMYLLTPDLRARLYQDVEAAFHESYDELNAQGFALSFEQSLLNHILKRKIDIDEAFRVVPRPKVLNDLMQKAGI